MRYNHKAIEAKWQKVWEEKKPYKAEKNSLKPKYYVLDMFPYPSGAGLHVGHVEGYTATDIIARYKRQRGFNVLHPMGWDSFGLPAEQYAVRTGTHPRETTLKNIDTFRRQLKSLGFSYDWDREFATSDPSYYKWTQWIFTKLYEKGLAYEADMVVNYCPHLGTVLANEEIEEGRSKEGGHIVEKRPLRQWVLKITEYAERLLEDLKLVDWPDSLKRLQTNWIGKSEGAKIFFPIEGKEEKIEIFTTCPHTLFGATYMVLSPEHPLVDILTTPLKKEAVKAYQKEVSEESEIERAEEGKKKTGLFIGSFAINPSNGERIPLWIADYVLMGYGTGAVMAVPSHDVRDFDFAKEFSLPLKPVLYPEAKDIAPEENYQRVVEAVQEMSRSWTGDGIMIHSSNQEISLDGLSVPLARKAIIEWLEKKGFGKRSVCYKLRDWLFSRQRYWGEPFPILHFKDGTKRVLDLDELPLLPPEIKDFRPAGDGKSPLEKVAEWVEVDDPKTRKKARRETNTMPQWAGSCWYYLRFVDPENTREAWSPDKENYWMPVDLYVGGVEHAVLHLLYARFWHKVLYDLSLVSTKEPFYSLRNQGIIVARSFQDSNNNYISQDEVIEKEGTYFHSTTGEKLKTQIEKMSKSKLNGVTPDDIIEEFGADSLRLYEMFMGPLEKEKVWNTDAVNGCRRFLQRFHDIALSERVTEEESEEATKLGARLVNAVTKDIEALQFNTAIAKMMEFINQFIELPAYPKTVIGWATQCLMPFAPHLASEIFKVLQFEGDLNTKPYPDIDESYLVDQTTTYVIQVNGKLRGRFDLPRDRTEQEIVELAKRNQLISKHIGGKRVLKVIFVPNKLLNLVTD